MKLCITATGQNLDASVDPHFGRARFFLLIDSESGELRALENSPGAHGAGVQAAQQMVDQQVETLITGSVGPNAFRGLDAAGINILVSAEGTVRDALASFRAGTLYTAIGPTSKGHGGEQK